MNKTPIFLLILVFGLLLILGGAVYQVEETVQVIITRFGMPVGDPVTEPGLNLKLPFIERANYFDKRFLEWDGDANQVPTKDKRFIWVDTYARWRISDPLLFFQRLRNEPVAQSRLDDILDGETRKAIANHNLLEVIRSSNRTPEQDESVPDLAGELGEIRVGRETIREEVLTAGQARTSDLGIEVLDVQFKRINYGPQVLQDVHARMISERQRIADRFRSEGQGERAKILGDMDRELKRIQSEAYREAEEIRGRADAAATDIYAEAYNQSADSRSFYEFLKTMETYERTIDPETWLLLSTDGEFYRFLKTSGR